ncbi:DMT family transporter [Niallia sp. 01092]|uniref:DMT family transporter n=1 Tax=Niallia sp. 01092 TaxID=3457759 RepID=UPI003FD536E3
MNRKKAILYMVIAAALWSIGGLFIKLVDWNPMAIAGARSGIGAIVMLCYLKKPVIHFKEKSTLLGACAYASLLVLFVSANKLTTSANAILLQFTAPIWVALFSGWFLKEKVSKSDWATIVFVMVGMVLFFVGDLQTSHTMGNFVALLSGVAMASMIIFIMLQKKGSAVEVTFLGNIFTFIICSPFFFLSMPSLSSLFALLILGIFQLGIPYIFYAKAIRHVTVIEAILIPIIEPLLNPVWVFLVTREAPGSSAVVGGILVMLAIISRGVYHAKKVNLYQE